jgi:type IV secretion system protein VirD4
MSGANCGIIVGKYQGQYLIYVGQQFVLLAAPTRSGKGVAVVIPNLLNYPDSVVVLDLKLENFRYTSLYRERNGQKVFLFAPFAEDGVTHRWNMLDTISRDRNFRVGGVLSVGQSLYPTDCDPKEKFWNDNARNLFLGIVLYLMETPDMPCTFGEVLRQGSGRGKTIKEHIECIIIERSNGENALSDECLDAFNRFLSSPENTLGNILSTFNAPLLIFANPLVDAATSATDFDITRVRKERMSIYFGIEPGQLADAKLLVNMFYSQLIKLNTKQLPEDNPELKYQCLLVDDEFTAMGKVGIIASANSFIAGYNIRLLTIIQSVSQLESVYGDKDTRTLVTNHGLQIMYPPREQKDANEYSEMLGYFTEKAVSNGVSTPRAWGTNSGSSSENTSDQKRALMMPQELKFMSQSEQIIIAESTKPILCHKARYYDDHIFVDRLKSVSPTLSALDNTPFRVFMRRLGFSAKALPTNEQYKYVAFQLREMSSHVPLLDIDLHKAKMERRIRPVAEGERIDLSKLAVDVGTLPLLDDPENPSQEQVVGLVDAFFSQLDWVDDGEPEGESDQDTSPAMVAVVDDSEAGGMIEQGSIEPSEPIDLAALGINFGDSPGSIEPGDEPDDDYFAEPEELAYDGPTSPPAPAAVRKSGAIDLSLLDN